MVQLNGCSSTRAANQELQHGAQSVVRPSPDVQEAPAHQKVVALAHDIGVSVAHEQVGQGVRGLHEIRRELVQQLQG